MRELKFRIWIKDEERYYDESDEESYMIVPNGNVVYTSELYEEDGEWFTYKTNATKDVIVEQYTGLKDKNGKEIYEGDILKVRGRAYKVKFDNYGQFYMENKNYHWLENGYSFRSVDIWCAEGILVEVIGNIHENPELLEAKDVD